MNHGNGAKAQVIWVAFEALGPFMPKHPLERLKITGPGVVDASRYCSEYFSEVKIQAVFVWPSCFVGLNDDKWKVALGQLEIFAQSHWKATRGEDLCGNREINSACRPMKYPPQEANSLMSFVYSAKYISKALMNLEKKLRLQLPRGHDQADLLRFFQEPCLFLSVCRRSTPTPWARSKTYHWLPRLGKGAQSSS